MKLFPITLKLTKPNLSIKRLSVEDLGFLPKKCCPANLATHGQICTSGRGENAQGKHERMRDRRRDCPERKSVPGQTSGSEGWSFGFSGQM